jgi:hypothetical protein
MSGDVKLDRAGIRRLIASGRHSGVSLAQELNISRVWLIELMSTKREMRHSAVTAAMNATIAKLVAKLPRKK